MHLTDDICRMLTGGRVILSTAYLPPVEYWVLLANCKEIFLEQWEYYQKQSYRNRCSIASANGLMSLNIPVEKVSGSKTLIRDVRISDHGNWQSQHLKSLESAYQSSPFYEYYADDFRIIYEKKHKYLWDFNLELIQLIGNLTDIQPDIRFTDKYFIPSENETDFRLKIHPKNAPAIINYSPYYQVFADRHGFLPNLSIVDLLFNMGNESIFVLKSF